MQDATTANSPFHPDVPAPEQMRAERERRMAHAQRCRRLPPVKPAESDLLVSQFLARGGGVTRCPTAYLLPSVGG
ncbi:hypothetical protein [Roseomonas sp. BN140053]|uniref:hypothetical protein n=1 Tax=Roseomonas sp. BN140053 TaxID=3391898 RepID=UPI0039E920AF